MSTQISNPPINGHGRGPSMTITPAGANGANGVPQARTNITFGALDNGASNSPATNPAQVAQPQINNLGVHSLMPRAVSPSASPSPIPQPSYPVGGRPPSTAPPAGANMSFGQFSGEENDNQARNHAQMQLGQEHGRRVSNSSNHVDAQAHNNHSGRGGFQGGRGRGNYHNNNHNGNMQYHQGNSFRSQHHSQGGRGSYRGHHQQQYSSPSMSHRQPSVGNASPGPNMAQMHMQPGMQGMPYGYNGYQPFGQIPIIADPSISYNAQQQMYYQTQYGHPSPRAPYNQMNYGNNNYAGQGPQPPSMSRQSSQMSSAEQRPASSMGQTPQTPSALPHRNAARTPSISAEQTRSSFVPPKKSSAMVFKDPATGAIIDFKNQAKPASTPLIVNSQPVTDVTPPSRTPSAVEPSHNRSESQTAEHKPNDAGKAMREAVAAKIAAEKKAKEDAEAEAARKLKEDAEEKLRMEEEARAAAELEAKKQKEEADRVAREAAEAEAAKLKLEEEEKARADKAAADEEAAKKAAESAAASTEEVDPKYAGMTPEEIEMEKQIEEMEREAAEAEAEELRKEEEYKKKKAERTAAEAAKQKAEEEAWENNMKQREREAEERERELEKKRAEGGSEDTEAKKMFAQLKGEDVDTPNDSQDEGVATPDAEVEPEQEQEQSEPTATGEKSMPPPARSAGARKIRPGDLTLNTASSTDPPEPSATLKSLTSAKPLQDPSSVSYPSGFVSPNPALNANAPADKKFKYNMEFLMQFKDVFKEKPSLDWDQKVRDAVGDGDSARPPQSARTPSGMGARSVSNRGGGFGVMGQFGSQQPRTLPPGTTSEQRFAAANNLRGPPAQANPFNAGRMGMGPPMARTPSSNAMGIPGSPRVGSMRGNTRTESKRSKHTAKHDAEANKAMPLTAGMDVGTLKVSTTGWKAQSVTAGPQASQVNLDGYMEADVVQKKVKAALNKMTPEKFEKISDQILEISAQSKQETDGRTMRQVIQLVFEKATDEAHWAPMYAKFCFKMLTTMSNDVKDESIKDKNNEVVRGGNLFRKYLLNRCQEEFERGWKMDLPKGKDGAEHEAVMLSDEYYQEAKAKRRGLGLVKFIGELFKLGMLTERIMHECVKKLLDFEGTPDDAEVESLSSLMRTIGRQLDSSDSKLKGRMDLYFERIDKILAIPDLPSRLRFMLMDVIDLRKSGWQDKAADKGPKTIQQIHEEAEAAKAQEEMQRLAQQANNRGSGRMPMGRGDVRGLPQQPVDNSGRVDTADLRRLGNRVQRSNPTASGSFGPSGLGARTNSRRGLGPQVAQSVNTSRTGTPPVNSAATSSEPTTNNAFAALAALGGTEVDANTPASPPQAASAIDRARSRSPEKKSD